MTMLRQKHTAYALAAKPTEKQRKQQTQLIMKLFELWNLTDKEKAIALGLSPHTQTSNYKYKTGKQDLPINTDTQDRNVICLLSIDASEELILLIKNLLTTGLKHPILILTTNRLLTSFIKSISWDFIG